MKLVEIKFRKNGCSYVKRGAYIYSVKKNGELYAHPTWYEALYGENTQEDVLARLQRLNPKRRYELNK